MRTRRALRHFRRRPMHESLDTHGHAVPVPQALSHTLRQASDAEAIRAQGDPNEVEHEKPLPAWLHLWHCYQNPCNLLLTAGGHADHGAQARLPPPLWLAVRRAEFLVKSTENPYPASADSSFF